MTVTLASLLTPQTQQQLFTTALQILQANGFPVQSWQPGGVERTRIMAFTTALADALANYVPVYTGGGFVDYAVGGWMDLLMQELYSLTRNQAVNTTGSITLTAASGVSSATYQAGQLIATFGATGNRYLNTGTVVLPAGPGSVAAPFQAEFPGASYADPSSSGAITLVTPIPGVTLTNPAGTYTSVVHTGAGTGTCTPGGSPTSPHALTITVTTTGQTGVAVFAYQLDGGPTVSLGVVSSVTNLAGTGINLTFANGTGNPSFILNDTYSFNTPGTWITQQGANAETDAAAGARCRARWSSLSTAPTGNYYYLLATTTPGVGGQVNQCIIQPDQNINNKVNIVVAGPGGVLPGGVITTIQTYISPRARGTDNPVVQSPATLAITVAGTVNVYVAQQASASAAIASSLINYVNGVGINGTLRIASIIDLIMNVAGVVDCSGITINGAATNLVLGSPTTFVLPTPLTNNLSYVGQ